MGNYCSNKEEEEMLLDFKHDAQQSGTKNMRPHNPLKGGYNPYASGANLQRSSIHESHEANANKDDHQPSTVIAEPVLNMNPYAEKAKLVSFDLTTFNYPIDPEHVSNPIYGPYKYRSNGDTYKGQYFRGQRCGRGELVTTKGEVYIGNWEFDQCNGKGRLILPNGDYYEGDFVNNQANGTGRFVSYDTKIIYQGEFKDDMQDGKGKETYPDGSYYIGDFVNDRKHGTGTFYFDDGGKYTGRFVNDVISGHGKMP